MCSGKGCSLNILCVTCHCELLCITALWWHTWRKHHFNRHTSVTAAMAGAAYDSSHSSTSSFPLLMPLHNLAPQCIWSPLYPGAFERNRKCISISPIFLTFSYLLPCINSNRTSILNQFFFKVLWVFGLNYKQWYEESLLTSLAQILFNQKEEFKNIHIDITRKMRKR